VLLLDSQSSVKKHTTDLLHYLDNKVNSKMSERHHEIKTSHARTVVRECCKGDDESQWDRGKFDPPPLKNPLTDGHQNLCT